MTDDLMDQMRKRLPESERALREEQAGEPREPRARSEPGKEAGTPRYEESAEVRPPVDPGVAGKQGFSPREARDVHRGDVAREREHGPMGTSAPLGPREGEHVPESHPEGERARALGQEGASGRERGRRQA